MLRCPPCPRAERWHQQCAWGSACPMAAMGRHGRKPFSSLCNCSVLSNGVQPLPAPVACSEQVCTHASVPITPPPIISTSPSKDMLPQELIFQLGQGIPSRNHTHNHTHRIMWAMAVPSSSTKPRHSDKAAYELSPRSVQWLAS